MPVNYASKILLRAAPVDKSTSKSLSHALLQANNFVYQTGKGLYSYLPLGQRVLEKLKRIIEAELAAAGAQKCSFPILGSEELWTRSERWNLYGSALFRLNDRLKKSLCLQPTCEEMLTECVSQLGALNKNALPLILSQTTEKFRDEMNPRFGLLRARQFVMNDTYTFDRNMYYAARTYERISDAYKRIFFEHLGLEETRIVAAEAGEMGGEISHEFHLPNASAEDMILRCSSCTEASIVTSSGDEDGGGCNTSGQKSQTAACSACGASMSIVKSVEVAHTFQLDARYSHVFGASHADEAPYAMCCFGIGVSRLIAAAIDICTISEKAMRLPTAIAPFALAIILPKTSDAHPSMRFAHDLVSQLASSSSALRDDVLVDDRTSKSIGRRLVDLNQIGVPRILIIPAKKSTLPHEIIKMEYYHTRPKSDQLEFVGTFTHQEILPLLLSTTAS